MSWRVLMFSSHRRAVRLVVKNQAHHVVQQGFSHATTANDMGCPKLRRGALFEDLQNQNSPLRSGCRESSVEVKVPITIEGKRLVDLRYFVTCASASSWPVSVATVSVISPSAEGRSDSTPFND